MYAVIQKDVVIFGSGLTPEEAVKDSKEWMERDCEEQGWEASDFPSDSEANPHEMVLVECTESLYQKIQKCGGDTSFIVHNNLAQTWEEYNNGT